MTEKLFEVLFWYVLTSGFVIYSAWRVLKPVSKARNTYVNWVKRDILVSKIAGFFEQEENWRALMDCWFDADGRSDELRTLLRMALTDVDFDDI